MLLYSNKKYIVNIEDKNQKKAKTNRRIMLAGFNISKVGFIFNPCALFDALKDWVVTGIPDAGCWMLDARCWMLDSGY